MDTFILYEEYRLIERNEREINVVWKGAQLLLFFLAFVFGSFCTFCFHVLMYLFDEKCVLFPKLLSIKEFHHSLIYGFVPDRKSDLPVDFVSTQWVEKSQCNLPTYVPLVSGICGLVWTTLFLMCSSGSRTLTGLQRPWRVLPTIIVFSIAMSGLCIYTSSITHEGLQELCTKLAEITNSPSCSFTVNVATLAHQRRIRGVFQAIQLTIISAWLHAACWMCSACLALIRILLVVDFQLVRVRAELRGNIERMLERQEEHIRTVSPENFNRDGATNTRPVASPVSSSSVAVQFVNKNFDSDKNKSVTQMNFRSNEELYFARKQQNTSSHQGLISEELLKIEQYKIKSEDHIFILRMLYGLLDRIEQRESAISMRRVNTESLVNRRHNIMAEEKQTSKPKKGFHMGWKKIGGATRDSLSAQKNNEETQNHSRQTFVKKSNLKHKLIQTDTHGERRVAGQKVQINSKRNVFSNPSLLTLKPPSDTDVEESPAKNKKKEAMRNKEKEPRTNVGSAENSVDSSLDQRSQFSSSLDKETQTPAKQKQD